MDSCVSAVGLKAAEIQPSFPGHPLPEAPPIDVSVCIANWNCRDQLRGCLQSLHNQAQGVHLETIVVDNASSDGAADMVAREFPGVILRRNSNNVGFARANNQAARLARGKYLFFLNNDTVVAAGALGRLIQYAETHPEVGMIGPRLRDGRGQIQVSCRPRPTLVTFLKRTSLVGLTGLLKRHYRRYRREDFEQGTTRPVEVLMGAAILLPRQVFFACGRWDESFSFGGEDLDLCFRVGRHYPLVYHAEVEITHYGRMSTRRHVEYAAPHIAIGFLRYLRKTGCGRLSLLAYKLIITLDIPVHLLDKSLQYLWRRCRGRPEDAEKSLLSVQGMWHFLTKGLVPFWKT